MKLRMIMPIVMISCLSITQLFAESNQVKENADNQSSKITEQNTEPKVADVAAMYKGVVKLHVALGDQVKQGQLLFELDNSLLNVQKKYNENNFKFMKEVLVAAKKLIVNHSISQDDLLQCERDFDIAKSQLEQISIELKNSKYYAPFSGTVTNIVNYDGSGLGDNNTEVEISSGKVNVNPAIKATVCNRWPGILELKVKQGDTVEKGQLLFEINTDYIKAQIAELQSKADYAKKVYDRNQKLYNTHSASLYNYYKSKIDYQLALTNLEAQKIMLKQYSNYAPFSGKVTKIFRYSGSGNGACKPVLELTKE